MTNTELDAALVEEIWQETQGRIARAQIEQLLGEAKDDFAHASITTYVSIFVRRQVKQKLAALLEDVDEDVETANVRFSVDSGPMEQPRSQDDFTTSARSGPD